MNNTTFESCIISISQYLENDIIILNIYLLINKHDDSFSDDTRCRQIRKD